MALGDIVLLRERTPVGPFTRAQIRDGLDRGELNARDLAHTPGLKDWLPLIEVLHHLDREAVQWPRAGGQGLLPPLPNAAGPAPIAITIEPSPPTNPTSRPPPGLSPVPPVAPSGNVGLIRAAPPQPPVLPLKSPALPATDLAPKPPSALVALEVPVAISLLKPASFMARFVAFAIDCAVLFLPVLAVFGFSYLVGSIQGSLGHRDPETARQEQALLWRNLRDLMLLVANGLAWIYAAGFESSRWQGTIGKQAMGLVVSDTSGHRLSFLRATGRHAAKYLSALPFFLGFMAAFFGSRHLAWHDRLSGTRVVKRILSS